jgi:hypothetical protein
MMRKLTYIIALSLLLSCSSEEPAGVGGQSSTEAGGERGNSVSYREDASAGSRAYSLRISPPVASRNSVIRAIPRGFRTSDAEIVWLLNGQPTTGSDLLRYDASDTEKGDTLQAKATIQGIEVPSNIIKIINAPPEISTITILPDVFRPGDTLRVEAEGSDADGDEITISYAWTKNGKPAGRSSAIEGLLKRGDKVSVEITPFDGEDYGQPSVLHREIKNMPPMIRDHGNFEFNGETYLYQVTAEDTDGDTLAYSIKSGPEDMLIDRATGLITWNVPPDFIGDASVVVSASDGEGGESTQQLTFSIRQDDEEKEE